MFSRRLLVIAIAGLFVGGKEQPIVAAPRPAVAVDRYGDPLPAGAVARLGTASLWHQGRIKSLAFSPDKRVLYVTRVDANDGGYLERPDNAFYAWDVATGKLIARFGHENIFSFPAWLEVCPDGKTLATCDDFGWCLRDAATFKVLKVLDSPFRNGIDTLQFSADGRTVVFYGRTEVHHWDIKTRQLVRCYPRTTPPQGYLSPDGKTAVQPSFWKRGATLCNVAGKRIRKRFDCGACARVAFSPDGKTFALAGADGMLDIRACTSARRLRSWKINRDRTAQLALGTWSLYRGSDLEYSPDGKILAVDGEEGVGLWNPATGKLLRMFKDGGGPLAFSRDGSLLACGNSVAQIWNVTTGKRILHFAGHEGPIHKLVYLSDGTLFSSGKDGTIRFWDVSRQREVRVLEKGAEKALAGHPSFRGTIIARGYGDGSIVLLDRARGKEIRRWKADSNDLHQLAVSPDETLIASQGEHLSYAIILWSSATGKERIRLEESADSFAFSADGQLLIAGDREEVSVWDTQKGKRLHRIRVGKADISTVAFAPQGNIVAFATDARSEPSAGSNTIRIRSLTEERELFRLPLDAEKGKSATCVVFSPDGQLLASNEEGGDDPGAVRIWDVARGQEVCYFRDRAVRGRAVAFAPTGRTVASGGDDGTILVWDLLAFTPGAGVAGYRITPARLKTLWQALGGRDAREAYRAFGELVHAPQDAVSFLDGQLRPVPAVPREQLRRWLADLDNDSFAIREKASRDLAAAGDQAAALVREALRNRPSPEQRRRARDLLKIYQKRAHSPEGLREGSAVSVLQQIGTPAARTVLTRLARGAAGASLTRAARSALTRLTTAEK